MSSRILSATQNGPTYWYVELQDVKTGTTFSAYWHESKYKLRCYEQKKLGSLVTQDFLDEYRDLLSDVEYYNRRMEESD